MAEPWEVAIGGHRGGGGVVVEADDARLKKAKRTQTRVACRPQQRRIWGAEGGAECCALRASVGVDDAINGHPRGVREIHRAFAESGIQTGPRVAHDGWSATAALPWEDLQMTHTAVNRTRGEVVEETDAPLPEEVRYPAANHVAAKWGAPKRWKGGWGGKCGRNRHARAGGGPTSGVSMA